MRNNIENTISAMTSCHDLDLYSLVWTISQKHRIWESAYSEFFFILNAEYLNDKKFILMSIIISVEIMP